MSSKINKSEVLNRIKEHFGLKSNAKLAAFLGIAPTTLSSWYSRDTFDLDIIYSKCVGLNLDWLLLGIGSKLRNNQSDPTEPTVIETEKSGEAAAFYRMYKEKDEENKELLKENVRLEERLRLAEAGKSDFGQIAESASSENTLSRTSQGVTSAGAHLKG